MNRYKIIIPALLVIAVAACSPTTQNTKEVASIKPTTNQADTALITKLSIPASVSVGAPVEMTFTVYNPTDTIKTFCKWHTPFEPLMSKYLTVKDANGQEADYKGAMAKRIMPPPADSYLKVNAKDSLSANVDVLKGYNIQNAGKYVITYEGQNMSGLIVKDSVSFVYIK